MGLMPFIGLQILLALIVGFFLRVNLVAAAGATFVNNPLTIFGIIWLQLRIGRRLLGPIVAEPAGDYMGAVNFWIVNGKALMAGSLATAIPAGLIVYVVARSIRKTPA